MAATQISSSSTQEAIHQEIFEYMDQYRPGTPDDRLIGSLGRYNLTDQVDYQCIYSECHETQLEFVKTANKCLAKFNQPPMSIGDIANWDSVLNSMERACTALDEASARDKDLSGIRGKLKETFRKFCKYAATGKLLTKLVPGDSFGSVIGGGLNVVFTCLEQTSLHRANVYKALERLPRILSNSAEYTKLAEEDTEVHVRTAKLYTEVCRTLEHILRWFILNPLAKGAKHLLNPTAANTNLSDRLADVDLAAKDLKVRVEQIMFSKQADMFKMQELLACQALKTHREAGNMGADIKFLVGRSVSLSDIEAACRKSVESLLDDGMRRFLEKGHYRKIEVPRLTKDDILQRFLYDPELIPGDVRALLHLGLSFSVASVDPDRVHAIQRHSRVRAWMTVDESRLLLLNGGADDEDLSTSFVSAKFMYSVQQQRARLRNGTTVIALAYFCSQHQNYTRDPTANPTELAMSLLLQLVDGYDFEAEELQCVYNTIPDDLSSIFNSFGHLLAALPHEAVVYVLIDGISYFTRPLERRAGFREVVESLVGIYREHTDVDEEEPSAALKMIFTSSTRSRFLEDVFGHDETLEIPSDMPPTSGNL